MKKSHDHTQLKRLAAISLVLMMCLSALPMLAPSASAVGDVTPLGSSGGGRGTICITFDNGFASDYEIVFPLFQEAGLTGTSFVVSNWVDASGYVTTEQLLEMQAAGWEIGSHSVSHRSLNTVPIEEATIELTQSKADLEARGLLIDTFAYPDGKWNPELRDVAADIYALQRGVGATPSTPIYYSYVNSDVRALNAQNPRSMDQLREIVSQAIAMDTIAIIYWHNVTEDGIVWDSVRYTEGVQFTIYEAVDYLKEMMDAYGLQSIRFRDLMDFRSDKIVKWVGETDGLASDGSNWDTGTAPADGSYLLFPANSSTKCTIDTDGHYAGIMTAWDYSGEVIIPEGVTVDLGHGGLISRSGYIRVNGDIISAGHVFSQTGRISTASIQMVQDGTYIFVTDDLRSLRISADVSFRSGSISTGNTSMRIPLIVDPGARLTIYDGFTLAISESSKSDIILNHGIIEGGGVSIRIRTVNRQITLGHMHSDVTLTNRPSTVADSAVTMNGPGTIKSLTVTSNVEHTIALHLAGESLYVSDGVTIGEGGEIGNGTVHTGEWHSINGAIGDDTALILRDGGTVKLAPAQSFNRLEIASDDGRTASWSMTAIGAQAPIVTGLRSGSYLWYLDGVEQGEVKADKDGTIALSYESTGLHTLSVEPTSMTEAMDSLYSALPLVISLVVLGGVLGMLGKAFGRLKF